jgi:hypothetical protein
MTLPIAENNVKILSICFQKNQDKIWSCKMNSLDQREFSMRSSLKLENSEMRAMLEVIKLSILDLKLLNLKEILIWLSARELICLERSTD